MKKVLLGATLLFSVMTFAQIEELKTLKKIYAKAKPSDKDLVEYETAIKSLEGLATEEADKVYKNFYKGMFPMVKLASLGEKVTPNDQMKLVTKENLDNMILAVNETLSYEKKTGVKVYTDNINKALPLIIPVATNYGFKLMNDNKNKEASDIFYKVYQLDKKNGVNLDNAARLAYQAEQYADAEKLFEEYLESDYFKNTTLFYATNLASGKEQLYFDKASRDRDINIKTHDKPRDEKVSSNTEIYKILADLASFNGNKDKAKKYFDIALEKSPNDPELLKYLSNYYLQLGYDLLKDEEATINEINNSRDNQKKYNELLEKRKNYFKKALTNFENALKYNSENVQAKEVLKSTYEVLDMKDKLKALEN
ncbi:MAG: tetratricopeptide repeat protein [Flavobacterium sp.]|jgi:tetratricopeptide (TPR) repeat protein|nr:tetratricopeptide repeat protein [Flavobacterium sp.]